MKSQSVEQLKKKSYPSIWHAQEANYKDTERLKLKDGTVNLLTQ